MKDRPPVTNPKTNACDWPPDLLKQTTTRWHCEDYASCEKKDPGTTETSPNPANLSNTAGTFLQHHKKQTTATQIDFHVIRRLTISIFASCALVSTATQIPLSPYSLRQHSQLEIPSTKWTKSKTEHPNRHLTIDQKVYSGTLPHKLQPPLVQNRPEDDHVAEILATNIFRGYIAPMPTTIKVPSLSSFPSSPWMHTLPPATRSRTNDKEAPETRKRERVLQRTSFHFVRSFWRLRLSWASLCVSGGEWHTRRPAMEMMMDPGWTKSLPRTELLMRSSWKRGFLNLWDNRNASKARAFKKKVDAHTDQSVVDYLTTQVRVDGAWKARDKKDGERTRAQWEDL